jgi:hypothetical protein
VLERAHAILGEAWQRRESAETQAEQAIERLRRGEIELEAEREAARQEGKRLVVWPDDLANAKVRYPTPPWSQR